jgi:hypothetical protein
MAAATALRRGEMHLIVGYATGCFPPVKNMNRRSSYKVTFLDRLGPEGVNRLQAAKYGVITFGAGVMLFGVLGSQRLGLSGWRLILFTLVGGFTLSAIAIYAGVIMGNAAGAVATRVYMGGDSTPYEEQFSQAEALVMQRNFAGALALYEEWITQAPNEPRVRIAAADLYGTHGQNPARAAELYREVQGIPNVPAGHDVYVTNKLADLYLGPLNLPGRALVEFRRLADRYAGTRAADHAKMAIANLKPDLVKNPHRDSGA